MWNVVKITWNTDERRGSAHVVWHEEIVATCPTIGEARATTARLNSPGEGYYWEIRPAPVAAPLPATPEGA